MTREEAKKYFDARLCEEHDEHFEWVDGADSTEQFVDRMASFCNHVGWTIVNDVGEGRLSVDDYAVVWEMLLGQYKRGLPTPDQMRVSVERMGDTQ